MAASKKLVIALCLVWGAHHAVPAHAEHRKVRGELLYMMHCDTCHTAQIYWRKQKLARDWDSLKAQVRRWQASIGLAWSEEEISDVAYYLNTEHYNFLEAGREGYLRENPPRQVLRK